MLATRLPTSNCYISTAVFQAFGSLVHTISRYHHSASPQKDSRSPPLHIFAICPFTTKIWQTYEPIYTIPFVYEHVILTINLANTSTPKAIVKLLLTITNYILTKLWSARNKLKYDRVLPNHEHSLKP